RRVEGGERAGQRNEAKRQADRHGQRSPRSRAPLAPRRRRGATPRPLSCGAGQAQRREALRLFFSFSGARTMVTGAPIRSRARSSVAAPRSSSASALLADAALDAVADRDERVARAGDAALDHEEVPLR